MLRIKSQYAHPATDGRPAPIGLSIVREDGVRLIADLSVEEATGLIADLALAVAKVATAPRPPVKLLPLHTVNGKSDGPWPYGTTHDMDCPGCEGSSFTASPRSETYWSS